MEGDEFELFWKWALSMCKATWKQRVGTLFFLSTSNSSQSQDHYLRYVLCFCLFNRPGVHPVLMGPFVEREPMSCINDCVDHI